jgi:hypothetical protein
MRLGGRTGISARGDAGCGEVAELELEIGMTRDGAVCRSHEEIRLRMRVARTKRLLGAVTIWGVVVCVCRERDETSCVVLLRVDSESDCCRLASSTEAVYMYTKMRDGRAMLNYKISSNVSPIGDDKRKGTHVIMWVFL